MCNREKWLIGKTLRSDPTRENLMYVGSNPTFSLYFNK